MKKKLAYFFMLVIIVSTVAFIFIKKQQSEKSKMVLLKNSNNELQLKIDENQGEIDNLNTEIEELRERLDKAEEKNLEDLKIIDGLVLIEDIDSSIIIDLRYATANNFTGQVIYKEDICALNFETAVKLKKANESLKKLGYKIKILDGYRPKYAQKIFWSICPDTRYVANPATGDSHNTGCAVDVTLVDLEGNEIEMPSEFDDFSTKASRNNNEVTDVAKNNVDILTEAMVDAGFKTITTEWWHYNDVDIAKYQHKDAELKEFLE
ncbi:MAG: M15 family metallopeptidase [Clostridiaceae bacterium]